MTKEERIAENLENLSRELRYEGIETNETVIELIDILVNYIDNGDEVFDEDCTYETVEELAEALEGMIDELRYEYGCEETIKILSDAYELVS